MKFDGMYYPYSSRRSVVYAKNGMIATSQNLAAQAGLKVLQEGGNAIDAAIAAAACLTVVEPTSCGIGGDAFAIVWVKGKLYGLNSSGPAPKSITLEKVKRAGYTNMPLYGWLPVTVPGAPAAWAELSKRFGKLELGKVLEPAIRYAYDGYPVSPVVSHLWKEDFKRYSKNTSHEMFNNWFETFAPKGRAPEPGEIWNSPNHADTLEEIAGTYSESFYRGKLADKIHEFSQKYGGYLTREDLETFEPEWVDPIKINYRGYDVWELPPNGQGMVALMALNILKGFDFAAAECADTYHKQIEAVKLAFSDGKEHITDIRKMKVKLSELLSESFARERRSLIGGQALDPVPGRLPSGGTVYLAAADNEGNMISFIQSNFRGFGSGLVVSGTGISLQNRGSGFSLDPSHVNCLEPGKKSYHTIIPGFLTKDDEPVGPFGVMGGLMQPQGHVQVLTKMIDFHLNPQSALDGPRWMWDNGRTVKLEPSVPQHIAHALRSMGHNIELSMETKIFGRGQIILRDKKGVLAGATDPRADGVVAAW